MKQRVNRICLLGSITGRYRQGPYQADQAPGAGRGESQGRLGSAGGGKDASRR